MVGIDLQADAVELVAVDAQMAGGRAQGFRQHHRGAAVQQPHRLMSARFHGHAGGDRFAIERLETNPQHFAEGVLQHGVECVKIRRSAPYAHVLLLHPLPHQAPVHRAFDR
ncbi:hypothetical protein D9M70_575830 [compost metagenome]